MRHSREAIELAFLVLRESVVDDTESPVTQREHDVTREQNKVLDRLLEEVMKERDELRAKWAASEAELARVEKDREYWRAQWHVATDEMEGVQAELESLKAKETQCDT